MNTVIQKRLALLREEMKRAGVDYYMIPTADYHNSEYVDEYFKTREYFSGFTGSNGTLVVGQDMAGLWTDGRYFIQAERDGGHRAARNRHRTVPHAGRRRAGNSRFFV